MKALPKTRPVLALVLFILTHHSCAQIQTKGQLSISEGAIIGTKKLLEPSILPGGDLKANYEIIDGNDGSYFQLHKTKSVDGGGVAYLHLETRKKLDRELTPKFNLNITNGFGFLSLTIDVLDINDNPPVFENSQYEVNINESVPVGSSLLKVTATDADEGKNALVSYFMANANPQFDIDAKSGLIKVKNKLKCEDDDADCLPCLKEAKLCSLVIVATDGGQPRQSAQTVVKVGLLETNDHDPKITFKVLPDSSKSFASINDQAKPGTTVAAISIADEDRNSHGDLEIIAGNALGIFELQSASNNLFILKIASRAKFARDREFNITFRANDRGIPKRVSEASLLVKIEEVNEFEPAFEKAKYEIELSESALPGSSVMIVQAIDKDDNADLTYSIVEAGSAFKIQPKSGLVTTSRSLDREDQSIEQVKIEVTDGLHSVITELVVHVQDVNDEKPLFDQKLFIFNVEENTPVRQPFGKVTATDQDLAENGRITYSFHAGNDQELFSINKITGEISANSNLDRELQDTYKLQVTATDNGQAVQLWSVTEVEVRVTDVNDNSPVFYPIVYHLDIKEASEIDLKASDADENSNLSFVLESSSPEFILDEDTGKLSVDSRYLSLIKSEGAIKHVKVIAIDSEGRRSPSLAEVLLYPKNRLRNEAFSEPEYEFALDEDSQLRQNSEERQVGQLGLKQSNLVLEVIDGDENGVFKVDNQGKIVTTSVLDREKKAEYTLKVVAANDEGFDYAQVRVKVNDLNDNLPQFSSSDPDVLQVAINSPIGHQVHRVLVSDPDLGPNGMLVYSIDGNNYFDIDQASGIMTLRSEFTSRGQFEVTVKVSDKGEQPLTNLKSYQIVIESNENDHTPVFDFDLYEVSLSEGTLLNTEVATMSAVDQDQDTIRYALIDNSEKFTISSDGKVILVNKLDRETQAYYSVVVTATDDNLKPFMRSSTSTLVIYVTDENDNAPLLDKSEYHFHLEENSQTGTVIGRVSATDLDVGRSGEVEYKFSGENALFDIERDSGFITSRTVIDREDMAQTTFNLQVVASDLGLVPQSSVANVVITIVDENDNQPSFSSNIYGASISEAAKPGAEVITISAKDNDDGANGLVNYEILNNQDELFKIDGRTGRIALQGQLDREITDKYDLVVQAKDHGSPAMTSTCLVKVQVIDENDQTPEFPKPTISIKVSEDASIGDLVYLFKAKDDDLGNNGKISYLLQGNNLNGFALNSESGALTVASQLDRETRDHVELVVNAVDKGPNPRTGSVKVTIEVTDVNDNAPVIQTTNPLINVKEGIRVGSKISKIEATDPDLGQNGRVKFSLKGSNDMFGIDTVGTIVTKQEIDREEEDQYQIVVIVEDEGQPKSLSSEKSYIIKVEDVNDNAPVFTSLTTALIKPGARSGSSVLTLKANDRDASSNGAVTYRLKEPSRLFKLDSVSGDLNLIADYENDAREAMSLVVIASDGALPSTRKSSSATITILGGRSDPGTNFYSELYEAIISENSPIGTPVITLALKEEPKEKVEYHVVGCESSFGKGRGLFTIDKFSGQITSSNVIDCETEGSTIFIQVVALIGPNKMSNTKVKVVCQDENDSVPRIDKNFSFELSEAFLPGQQLGFVRATDPDENSILTYSLGLATQNFLNIDAQSGALTLTSSLDRETMSSLEVVIIASDGVHTSEWKKIVPIKDINDNAPTFPTPTFSFDIFENAERGAFVGKIEADDIDENDKITYSFISDWGLDTFSIDPTSGIITSSGTSLDHEHIEHYILTVSASDSGSPVLTATSTVYINVKDVNDNPPNIEKSLYEVHTSEDIPLESPIVQIKAWDKDSEFNTRLQFSIDHSVSDVFRIDGNGTIFNIQRLDRESVPFYSFKVTVADSDDTQDQLISSCNVQITIDDTNDQVPLFEVTDSLRILENSPPNSQVAALRAVDNDVGKNAEIEYLLEDSLGGKFSIGRIDGVLRSVKSLDREEQDVYSLSITAIDNGSPRLSSRVEIIVNVEDINDNPPRFEQKQYSASVHENASIGASILEARATDLDVGNNGKLRFSIISGDQRNEFEIGETTGLVRVAKRLDYERQNSYKLTLQVQDSASTDPRYDTAEVSILILDTNDNAPLFEHSPYTVYVVEELAITEPIFTVKARDRDGSPAFNEVEYSIRAGGQNDDLFSVNATTGQVYVKSILDREKQDKMTLEVLATDSGSPRLTGTGTVYVIVEDINDHKPEFENDLYEFSIAENSDVGSPVGEVLAIDNDANENADIKYHLIGTTFFQINASSGLISVDQNLDREFQDNHKFMVVAQDSSKINPKTSSATIAIRILDENDNKPTFDQNSTDYYIPPGLKSGDFILGVFASDLDEGENAKLMFSLKGKDAAMFTLNRLNGVLVASDKFEDRVSYDITISVSDHEFRSDNRVSIILADELIVPSFDNAATPPEVNMDEDAPIGSNVVTFRAESNTGEAIKYAIAGGNLGHAFDVDDLTGIVYVNQTLDYETTGRYELWVKAFYETRPLYTAAKKISVVISDKNDNAPHFESSLVKVVIPEGLYPPFEIAEVFALDQDTGDNGIITYHLVDDNAGMFVVDEDTGLIRCMQQLDREVLDRYTLKLEATDNGAPRRLSSTATILLSLQDVNDNPPRFTRLYSINVTENTAIGTNLLKVETVDLDSEENAQVKYKFASTSDTSFAIHETMGNISIASNLDREVRDEYALKVQASDGTWTLDTVVTVTIQDANDNQPIFDQETYEFNYVPGGRVGKVHALDRDASGPNSEVTYELSHESEFFDIAEASGEILVSKELSARTANDVYHIRVIAKDGGNPPMSSECQVKINLISEDSHKPVFKDNFDTDIGVPYSISVATVIMEMNATDEDEDDQLSYFIEGADGLFEIDEGRLKVIKALNDLEGSSFQLSVKVVDQSGLFDERKLKVSVTGENSHSPVFQAPTSRIYIREDEAVGNVIITVKAGDQDEGVNGQIEYSIIKGDPEVMFKIDKSTGSISVAQALDYEHIPVYNLIVKAEDRGFYSTSSTSSVKIILQDVDDNPPTFDQTVFEAKLGENAPPGTVVTQMIANDLDSSKNADIVYNIIESDSSDKFEIDPVTGIIKSLATFDFELVNTIILKIQARNPKSKDQEPAIALLKILITGENEYYPRFKQPVFQFTVSESALDSSLVGQVEAIDNDAGPDGEVYYYFVGSSNDAGFEVDKRTGVITVKNQLDRESQNRYVLTILAKNFGSIRGNDTDEAQVIIQVQDGNDPPVFKESKYQVEISEDSKKGTFVVQVTAEDKDVRPRNSQFIYVIADGNVDTAFSIGPNTGEIVVNADELDRETSSVYRLAVQAVDNGSPPAIGETEVVIELLDVNDSPPELEQKEAFIKENSPPNSFVIQLTATDADLPPNAGPFKFTLVPGYYSPYFSLEPETGVITTKTTLDREEFNFFDLSIEVQDSGQLTSRSILHVEVGDENDNPSKSRNVLVIIKNFEGTFPGGVVLNVRPDDPDIKGNYNCNLINGPENIFVVNPDCSIKAGRIHNGREYDLEININDGKHADVQVLTKLNFVSFSEFAVHESVAIRFKDSSAEKILGFFDKIKGSVENRLLELLSMSVLSNGTVECFVASRENDLFLPREDTLDYLNDMNLIDQFDSPVMVDYDPCEDAPCLHNGKCSKETIVLRKTEITESGNTIFNSPVLLQNVTCQCLPEFSGDRCQTQKNPCVPNPCEDGGQCFQEGDTFRCLCPPLRGGKTCQIQKTNACLPNPCLNGGSCQNAKQDGFFCLCRPGYQGEFCQTIVDTCRQNPCLNGGTCISLNPNYKCRCHDHFYGNHCEHSTFGFEELSYASFPPLDANTNDISVIFATSKPNSLLVYNFGKSAGGRSDFLSVELVNGHPRLSWGGSRTAITRLSLTSKRVDTGRWYKVTATRNNRVASLSVEDCTESGEYCKTCQPDDPRCFAKEIGEAGTLVFHKNPMYFGGIHDESAIADRPGQLDSVDFVGCIKSISINGNEKNLITESLNKTGLTDTCNYVESGSCSRGDECGPTGTCVPLWSYNKCKCGVNDILALDCGNSFLPYTLTENQEVHYKPTRMFKHATKLSNSRWRRESKKTSSMTLSFRTLASNANLLKATNLNLAYTHIFIKEDGVLEYRSRGALASSNEVVLNSDVNVADGSWHTITIEVTENVLQLLLDESRVGFEVEFSAVHDFTDAGLDKVVIGGKNYRGCITNFTLNNELQSLDGGSRQLLSADVPTGVHLDGCDVEILRVAQEQTAVETGIWIVVVFLILVLVAILASFSYFKMKKKLLREGKSLEQHQMSGVANQSFDLREDQLNNSRLPLQPSTLISKPDIIEAERTPRFNNDQSFEAMEHYDIENASSIAPSDIDIVYHYKGYREGHRGHRSLPKKKGRHSNLHNTPLARLSPSSEMSHNTPRILTLKDLSGKPLPTSLLTEQSERSLNSPLSHVSSGSRQVRGGLTSENVARFNNAQRSTTPKNTSTLVNTLDLVSMGSDSRKKTKTPTSVNNISTSTSDTSDEDHDDDSFTCSEYECDSTKGGLDNGHHEPNMVFSKLMDLGPSSASRPSSSRRRIRTSDEDEDEDVLRPPRLDSTSWERLLTWWPDYESFSGVFKDIAELPHTSLSSDQSDCRRPPPLGEHQHHAERTAADEEYI